MQKHLASMFGKTIQSKALGTHMRISPARLDPASCITRARTYKLTYTVDVAGPRPVYCLLAHLHPKNAGGVS